MTGANCDWGTPWGWNTREKEAPAEVCVNGGIASGPIIPLINTKLIIHSGLNGSLGLGETMMH
jgi:hypothetical protein